MLSIGRVGRPHGLDGSFHVTRPRTRLLENAASVRVGDRTLRIERRAGTPERPILRLAACHTREAIEALRGEELLVPRAATPPLGEDEWLAEDFPGCEVFDGDRPVGKVVQILAYPSCELLEVERPGAPALLVPLISDAVRTVDIPARRIDVDLVFLGEA